MPRNDEQIIERTLDALERLTRMFQAERLVYLAATTAAFGLLIYAAVLMFTKQGVDAAQLGLIFGASGITGFSSARIAFFLNKAFNLIEDLIRKLAGMGPPREQ